MLLSKSSVNVMEQFDITPDPKTQAFIGLISALGVVYGPRAVAIKMRRAQQKKEEEPGVAGVYTAEGHAAGTTVYAPAVVGG